MAAHSSRMSGRQSVAQMAAEFLRELGVLLVAFGPLDYVFADPGTPLTRLGISAIVSLGMVLFGLGMVMERTRRT